MPRVRARRATGTEIVSAFSAIGEGPDPKAIARAHRRVNKNLTAPEQARLKLAAMEEDGLLHAHTTKVARRIVEAGLAAADINPAQPEPPPEWVAELGPVEAAKKFRLAQAAWAPTSKAPHVFSIASQVVTADARVQAAKNTPPAQLNVAVQVVMTPQKYDVIEVDE